MWHPTKNGRLTPNDVSIYSDKVVWFLCERNHEIHVSVKTMVKRKRNGCKYCYGREATPENNLEVLRPDLMKYWDKAKNKIKPSLHTQMFRNKKVYWICLKGHSYPMTST